MMRSGLTRMQAELLAFIRDYVGRNECSPSFEEMAAAIGINSKGGVHRLVVCLEERGHIRRIPGRARAIEVLDQSALPWELEQKISAYCRHQGITRATFDQRAAEQHLRSMA